jgi:hypothetical protein
MTEDQKAFEAWMSNNGEYPKAIAKNNDGLYSLMQTFIQWAAWEAACEYKNTQTRRSK